MNEQYNKIQKKLLGGFFGFWIKKRRFTFILVGIIVFLGVSSMVSIPKESSPEIDFGVVSISTLYQGATPQDIDNLITNKIEKEIKDISGIKKISSTSSSSISNIMIEFENDADMTQSLVDIKDAVDKINLPSDAETPVVQDISVNNEMMFSVLIYGDQDKFSQFYLKDKGRKIKANLE
ncbi:MAG TPA: efflux RND transporter permease subunit, partial [Candidatus Absconditabacterales bacterium]|nr:efflux RND transporter permease subunit [Candidatus Absconditabacterales bacterium]